MTERVRERERDREKEREREGGKDERDWGETMRGSKSIQVML